MVQRNRCHGASFRKESQDAPSSDGGYTELLGFSAGADPQHSQLPTHVGIVTQHPRVLGFSRGRRRSVVRELGLLGADVSGR